MAADAPTARLAAFVVRPAAARRSTSVSRAASTLVAALLVAACGGTTPPSPPAVTPMPAGEYTSLGFRPAVTFTVPDGWLLAADSGLYLNLRPVENEVIGIHLFRDPKAASQDPTCPAAAEPGVGSTAFELAAWIAERPGLAVTTRTMATVGGLVGVSIDVALRADWQQACPFANGVPSVPLFNSPEIDHWVVVGNERLRIYLLDLPDGGTVVVDLDAFDGAQFEDLVSRAGGVVRSLQFARAGAPASPAASP
jgi:hypothetical protein